MESVSREGCEPREASCAKLPERVAASPAAVALVARLKEQHGDILLYQSHGCCDGSTPMCLMTRELAMGAGDREIGAVAGVPYFVSDTQWTYLESVQVLLDVAPGALGTFSLEEAENLHFTASQRLWTPSEWQALQHSEGQTEVHIKPASDSAA
jgi:uncharacterized protein